LHAQSAGNPYFLIELNRAPPGSTPPQLAELVRARLNRLPDATRQVLQTAAVLDADIDFSTLRQTSGRGEEETLDALDALLETNVLVEREGHYQFVHPLMAAVVREDLNIARRSFLNRRAAEALQTTHAGRLGPVAGRLANHYVQAGRPALAARYAEQAAERALELTATAEAVAFYRQALSLEPTPVRRLGLSRALLLSGELEVARETLRGALAEFEAGGDVAGAARACLALAESYLPAGRGDETIEWAERALLSLDAQREPEILAEAHYLLAAGGGQVGRSLAEAEAHLLKAAALATANDWHEMAAGIQFQIGNLQAQRGDLPPALEAFEHSIALARAADAHFQEILGHNNLAYHALLAGDLDKAWEHVEIGLAMVEESALFLPRQYLYSTQGEIALAQDQLDEAETWFRRALVEAEKYGNQLQAANIRANLGLVAQARGDLDEALVLLKDAHHAASGVTGLHLQTQIDLWLAELYTARGERTATREALARAEARLAGRERRLLQERAAQIRATL
jgi:tetratricopeptide (TPR) repeat protein